MASRDTTRQASIPTLASKHPDSGKQASQLRQASIPTQASKHPDSGKQASRLWQASIPTASGKQASRLWQASTLTPEFPRSLGKQAIFPPAITRQASTSLLGQASIPTQASKHPDSGKQASRLRQASIPTQTSLHCTSRFLPSSVCRLKLIRSMPCRRID